MVRVSSFIATTRAVRMGFEDRDRWTVAEAGQWAGRSVQTVGR